MFQSVNLRPAPSLSDLAGAKPPEANRQAPGEFNTMLREHTAPKPPSKDRLDGKDELADKRPLPSGQRGPKRAEQAEDERPKAAHACTRTAPQRDEPVKTASEAAHDDARAEKIDCETAQDQSAENQSAENTAADGTLDAPVLASVQATQTPIVATNLPPVDLALSDSLPGEAIVPDPALMQEAASVEAASADLVLASAAAAAPVALEAGASDPVMEGQLAVLRAGMGGGKSTLTRSVAAQTPEAPADVQTTDIPAEPGVSTPKSSVPLIAKPNLAAQQAETDALKLQTGAGASVPSSAITSAASAGGGESSPTKAVATASAPIETKPEAARASGESAPRMNFAEWVNDFTQPQGGAQRPLEAMGTTDKLTVGTPAQIASGESLRPTPLQMLPIEIGMQAVRGVTKFQIRLDPAELGRVDVKLEIRDNGEVNASLVVDRVETLAMLKRDASTLQQAFEQAGLKQSPDGLTMSLRDGQNGQQQERGNSLRAQQAQDDEALLLQNQISELAMRRVLIPHSSIDRVI